MLSENFQYSCWMSFFGCGLDPIADLVWSSDDVSDGEDGGGSGNTCLRLSVWCNTY
ncbi:hypothetical protein F2Q68_00028753 [Brassica cretica]|uniref:Uncharacterized protein n=1 Tax=Brassica cretica TaxID=69181 RepID=A0A8S9G6S9_BRACR|nr:hypothetical protein F2Q68_00028753 [Brassica cretica]